MTTSAARPTSLPWFSAVQLAFITAAAAIRQRPELVHRALSLVRGY